MVNNTITNIILLLLLYCLSLQTIISLMIIIIHFSFLFSTLMYALETILYQILFILILSQLYHINCHDYFLLQQQHQLIKNTQHLNDCQCNQ